MRHPPTRTSGGLSAVHELPVTRHPSVRMLLLVAAADPGPPSSTLRRALGLYMTVVMYLDL